MLTRMRKERSADASALRPQKAISAPVRAT